jgi:phenylacetate-coenzyme A ligase PaaK-like adenylate-forming protein
VDGSTEIIDLRNSEIEARQSQLLTATVERATARHPYYRALFRRERLEPAGLAGLDGLQRLPLTYKRDFLADPDAFRLESDGWPEVERTLWDTAYTTGTTTGRPTPFYSTTYDYLRIIHLSRRMSAIRGIRESDTVANLFPLMGYPQGAFLRVHAASIGVGFKLLTAAPGPPPGEDVVVHRRTDEVVRWLGRSDPTVLWGVASYIRRLAMRAVELGVAWPSVRMLALSGEPLSATLREDLRGRLAVLGSAGVLINNSLGMSEMQGGLVECAENSGQHNPAPELFLFEIVDPDTGHRMPDGEQGLLCLTHLDRRGTVLLRYVLGDVIAQTREACPNCGREGTRLLRNPTRTSELFKIKATLVDPNLIAEEMARFDAVEEYRIVFTKDDIKDPYSEDAIVIQIAGPAVGSPALQRQISDRVRAAVSVRPRVETVPVNEIYDPEATMKSRRVVDVRPKHYET